MPDLAGVPRPESAGASLVGRERELAVLRDALATTLAGRGALVLVGGEAGIGKTTLAEALCREASARGALVLVGRCYDLAETPPYGPWAEALARATRDLELAPPPDLTGGGAITSQAALFAQVRDYLTALAAHQPLVLFLEDLHWADPASLDLLRAIGRGLDTMPVLVLATYRADELTRRHPLYTLLPILDREARAARLDLRPFDVEEVRALVAGRAALPADDAARLVAWLVARAQGNAFFTAQLLRALEDERALHEAADGWALGDLGAVGLPAPLRQVLDARVDRLGEAARGLLALAAVIGQEVSLALWATVAETDENGLLDTIERAVEARLVVESPDGAAVRFAHALIREALYEGLLATRRRRVHRRAGEALAASVAPDPDAVAYHFQRAGDPRAADWLVAAGERAQHAYAWPIAAARFEAALASPVGQGIDAVGRGVILLRLARLRRYADPQHSLADSEEAIRVATALGDQALAACAQMNRGLLHCYFGRLGRGTADLAASLSAAQALGPEGNARLAAIAAAIGEPQLARMPFAGPLANWLTNAGRYEEARAVAERVEGGPIDVGEACFALAQQHAALGHFAEARRDFARAGDSIRATGHHAMLAAILVAELQWTLRYRPDDLLGRQRLAAEASEMWDRAGGSYADPLPRVTRLPLLLLEGAWAEARPLALAARAVMGGGTSTAVAEAALIALAQAQGDAELARMLLRAELPEGLASVPGDVRYPGTIELQLLAAATALGAGDLSGARAWLGARDRWLAWNGTVAGRAEGALAWAAYHRAASDLAAARDCAERALAHASDPRQPLALLASHRLLGELDTEAARYAAAATHLDAALALADACAAPYERALTLLAQAESCAVRGEADPARAALDEARAILAPLDARPALARAADLAARLAAPAPPQAAPPFGLTARAVEVLRLVAQGLANADVAERLFLSPRTVGQHLRSIYNKLGVDNRTAAAHFATAHGLT